MLPILSRWLRRRRSLEEIRRVADVLTEENYRLRKEIMLLRDLCRALRDVNTTLDERLIRQEEAKDGHG